MNLAGIYCIECLINGRKYVGQGKVVENRMWNNHKGINIYFDRDMKEYGKDNFKRYIVIYCDNDENTLNFWEEYFIKNLHSHISEGGYNISWGGLHGMKGAVHSIPKNKNPKYLSNRLKFKFV